MFEFYVYIECSVEETAACHSRAVFLGSFYGCLFYFRVIGQTQIRVRAKHKHFATAHYDFGILFARYSPEIGVNTRFFGLLRCIVLYQFLLQ